MRLNIPEEHQDNPIPYISDQYAREIVLAGYGFSKAVYQHSTLSLREFEAARIRTAQLNGCLICKSWRSERDLPLYFDMFGGDLDTSVAGNGPAPDEAFYEAIANWRESRLFSDREQLAIEYAEGMGQNPHGIAEDEEFWKRARAAFSDNEIVDLTYCIASWMGLGRATHVLGLDSTCMLEPAVAKAS